MGTHEIVILGGSYAGLIVTHDLIKKIIPQVTKATGQAFHVTMISLSTHFHFSVAVPRAVVDPALIPISKLEVPIKEKVPYTEDKFTFIHGEVTTFDTTARTVHYIPLDDSYAKGEPASLHYDSLFVVLGSHTKHPAYKLRSSHTDLVNEIEKLHKEITEAKSIIISGGGPVAIETAGEIASKYEKAKAITLITSGSRLLQTVNPDIGTTAKSYLEAMDVHVTLNSRVTSATKLENGQTRVELGKGESVDVDLYIDATGIIPNNTAIPKELLTERGYLDVDAYQRVPKAGALVYGMGDIVGGWGQVAELMFTKGIVVGNWGYEVSGGKVGKEAPYSTPANSMILVPVGRKKAVATAFGWRFPSWLGWLLKGRDFMIGKAETYPTSGV